MKIDFGEKSLLFYRKFCYVNRAKVQKENFYCDLKSSSTVLIDSTGVIRFPDTRSLDIVRFRRFVTE